MIIVPERTPLTEPYWAAAETGVLTVQECHACGRVWHPPQPDCPDCVSRDWAWRAAGPAATVATFTVVRQAAHGAVADSVPYIVALVDVEPGVVVICNVLDAEPEQVRIGAAVELQLGVTPAGASLVEAYLS